tara:strand:- start:4490 stop:5428 length:939 start_codon:yes stop_codon:yes gene_type:complete
MFFNLFPNTKYDFEGQGKAQNIKNIFRSVRAIPEFIDEFSSYKLYDVINGERPDIISQKLYNTTEFYWTFFVINDFLHDGYRAWPMSQENLLEYLSKQYEGFVVTTNPEPILDADGLDDYSHDSIAGKFDLGETVFGSISGAKGTLTKKDSDMNQLIIQDVTLGSAGVHPITGAVDNNITGGQFIASENIVQNSNSDQVQIDKVFKYLDAPYKYFLTGDTEKRPVTNRTFINSQITNTNTGVTTFADKVEIAERNGVKIFQNRNTTVDENNLSFQTYKDYEIELNDQRSQIRFIDPLYIGEFVNKFKTLINQ